MIYNSKTIAFRKVDTNRAQLAGLINNPVMESILDAVEDEALPKNQAKTIPGISPDITDARDTHYRRGICAAIQTIRGCIYPLNQAPDESEDETPFEHSLPENLRIENLPESIRKHFK